MSDNAAYKEMQASTETMTYEEIKATLCSECGFYHGAHRLSCSQMTLRYMQVLLRASHDREKRNTAVRDRLRAQVALWQGKFNTVKHENNKLRHRLYRDAIVTAIEECAEIAKEIHDQRKSFDAAGAACAALIERRIRALAAQKESEKK